MTKRKAKEVKAWAIADPEIDVRTVSDTKVAAMVNFLCVARSHLVHRGTSDERVRELWEYYAVNAQLVPVTITLTQPKRKAER